MDIMDYIPQFGQNVSQNPMVNDDALMQIDLKRKLALADSLRQQEMPQGQMVSGRYVAPAWTQILANTLGKIQAGNIEKKAYEQYGQAQQAKQAKLGALLEDLSKGKETKTYDNTPFQIQVPNGQTPTPTPTDKLGGMQPYESGMKTIDVPNTIATSTYTPYTQQEFMSKVGKVMPEMLPKFLETQFSQYNKDRTPIKGSAGDVFFDPVTHQPIMKVPNKPEKPTAPVERKRMKGLTEVQEIMIAPPSPEHPEGQWKEVGRGPRFAPEKPEPDPYHLNTPKVIPPKNANGWALHTDKNGNMAYVSPDGKSFEEVK
jgi:hypothetical protein